METYDILVAAFMGAYLICAALHDSFGEEVPDLFTIPYAVLGISASVYHQRHLIAVIGLAILFFILCPWRPKWLLKLNHWLIARHYPSEELMAIESAERHELAETFSEKHFRKFAYISIGLLIPTILLIVYPAAHDLNHVAGIEVIICVLGLVIFGSAVYYGLKPKSEKEKKEDETPMEMSAFGGADVIVFVGILGFYGLIPFLYGIIASLCLYLLWIVIVKFIKKEKAPHGTPMLPALCLTGPVRLIIAVTVCPSVVSTIQWAVNNPHL